MEDPLRKHNWTTRYKNRFQIDVGTEEAKLDWLTARLSREIDIAFYSDNILDLETLVETFYSDGLAALREESIAYYIRYVRAYERGTALINAYYDTLPVLDLRY